MSPVKQEAVRLIEKLPETATWRDVAYTVYVREKIERGLADVSEGRVFTHDQVKEFAQEGIKRK